MDLPDEPSERPEIVGGDVQAALGEGMLGDLMEQAQQLMAAQAQAAEREVEGSAGGGAVRIRATGAGKAISVSIAPEVVDPDDMSMLEDLVLAALHDLDLRVHEVQRDAMGPFGQLFGAS
ncbi:MAG: YbaB/EbfC family nucleoid-associated protein [Actinomycetota bacterium]